MPEVEAPPITPLEPGDVLDNLSGVELVQLAMLAFIHMDKQDQIPKEELYGQILQWFDAMTDDVKKIEPHQYVKGTETLQ